MIHAVGAADEVRVLIFKLTPLAITDTGVEVAQELRLQGLPKYATGAAELIADDFLISLGGKRSARWIG
ncbi:hypothetical protein D3C81_1729310 [compost metagenome]